MDAHIQTVEHETNHSQYRAKIGKSVPQGCLALDSDHIRNELCSCLTCS